MKRERECIANDQDTISRHLKANLIYSERKLSESNWRKTQRPELSTEHKPVGEANKLGFNYDMNCGKMPFIGKKTYTGCLMNNFGHI